MKAKWLRKLFSETVKILMAVSFFFCPGMLPASTFYSTVQQNFTVKGNVTDENGQTFPGVNVVVKGTTNGVLTDENGNYSINVADRNTAVLIFSIIGYETREEALSGRAVINVKLRQSAEKLQEIVVTALGIKREKKALGYAVQDVKSEDITKSGTPDVTTALQGKIAGLNINTSGTGAGGSSKIVIRGNSSLADNNAPLWVVDGIPFDNSTETGNFSYGGYDRAGGAFDLNPDDIESVSVLKGPAAAALYGSRAGNGVILVTTKKGGTNGKLGVNYTYKMSVSPIAYSLNLQDVYGQGTNGEYDSNAKTSWGAKMEGQSIPAWWDETKQTAYGAQNNTMDNFYKNSRLQSHNVSISGGKDGNTFRLSLGNDYIKGNMPDQTISKTSVDYVARHRVSKFLDASFKANYVNTVGRNRSLLGFYSTMYYLYTMPRNIQLSDLSAHRFDEAQLAENNKHVEGNWTTSSALYRNPYFLISQEHNRDQQNKVFGFAQLNFHIAKNLNLRLKQGLDYDDTQYRYNYKYEDARESSWPMMEMTKSTRKELNSEFLLNYKKSLGDFSLDLSLGGNRMYNLQESIYGGSGKFSVQGAYYLSLGTSQKCQNTKYEKEINSLYGFANIGYKNYLFLDITGRNDWSSTLPADNRSYFYPSFSFSGVVTSLLDEYGIYYPKDVISYGKIRASFAQVGKDTDPYQLSQTYSTQNGGFGYLYAYEPTTLANIKLKPEIANSLELGTEWKFFKGRYGFDFTYYKTITKNQVLDIPYIFSAGYTSKTANVGKISNKGIELTLSANVINSDKFNLDLNANFAKNVTRVNELDASVNMYEFGNMQNGLKVVAIEGHKLGEIYDNGYKRDSEGNKIIGSDGLPEKTDSQKVLGCIQPDFTGSFSIGAGYKRLSLSGLFSFQKGGDVYSFTEAKAANAGTAKCTADRSNRVVTGVTENGQANTMSITAQNYWQNGVNSEEFIYDASFIKLKELSLNYSFSKKTLKILSRNLINSLNVSVFGSNLFYLVKHTPGTTPDGSAISSNIFSQAVDFSPLPNSRTFGFSIKIGF